MCARTTLRRLPGSGPTHRSAPTRWNGRGGREEILDWERGEMFYIGFCMGARLMQEIMECPEFH